MSTNQSKNVQVTLTVPQEFHKILEEIAKSFDQSVEEYVLYQVISGLDFHLQNPAGDLFGFGNEIEYADQLRAIVAGGAA